METRHTGWVVIKLGGSSVSRREYWDNVAMEIRSLRDAGKRVLIVQSALSGITDQLERLLDHPTSEQRDALLGDIEQRHRELATAMSVDAEVILPELERIRQQALGAALTGETTPRLRAAVLAGGELMASRLAARYLETLDLDVGWQDARELLIARSSTHTRVSSTQAGTHPHRHFLNAICSSNPDPALQERLTALPPVVLTQGFIAADTEKRTVILGRGGSDTSAAYFAAQLEAERLEIWTDVPGMFTANPHEIPAARLLRQLDYDEAQEIAGTGAKVLHPRCIEPARRAGIPLLIRYTPDPSLPGTHIGKADDDGSGRIKAISVRRNIRLVEMSTSGMWQQVGFLADAFALFKQFGLSIDLVATSETTVTVSLDPLANSLDNDSLGNNSLGQLLDALEPLCRARVIQDCATVSLVGRRMRANLHRLAPVLELFDERHVHLVSQAANDLNFTVVVDNADAARLARQLHALMITADQDDAILGESWQSLFAPSESVSIGPWWNNSRAELLDQAARRTPCYVYDGASLDAAATRLLELPVSRIFFAMKANNHPAVLRRLAAHGIGFECVSPGEVEHVRMALPELSVDRLLFTPNFAPREDYAFALEQGIAVTLDNLHALREWPELFRNRDILLRIDPGNGAGHHKHVRTAGTHSKFGIPAFELGEAATLAESADATVIGLHAHAGSGVRDAQLWQDVAVALVSAAEHFPSVRILDLGGGFGVPERHGDAPLDTTEVAQRLQEFLDAHPDIELWIEPGRYLVAQAGVLLARVTQLKGKSGMRYVGIDAGMHSLIRPALYGAHHDIVNLTRLDQAVEITANVVGPICETGDVLGIERRLPECREGDIMLIANAGAYGRVMSSEYNLRGLPEEILLE